VAELVHRQREYSTSLKRRGGGGANDVWPRKKEKGTLVPCSRCRLVAGKYFSGFWGGKKKKKGKKTDTRAVELMVERGTCARLVEREHPGGPKCFKGGRRNRPGHLEPALGDWCREKEVGHDMAREERKEQPQVFYPDW